MIEVKIPKLMRHLPKDPRGYPIPMTVFRDKDNKPHFAINDSSIRAGLIIKDCCPICGNPLHPKKWFVGGPVSAFDPNGAYIDPAMHYQCMAYALQVCPYLAAPNYTKRIDNKTLKAGAIPDSLIFINNTMLPDRPEIFVAVECSSYDMTIKPLEIYLRPKRPYSSIEYWRYGKKLRPPPGGFNVYRSVTDRSERPGYSNRKAG
jgi:hypothetical protein